MLESESMSKQIFLALRVPVVGTINVDTGDMVKNIYECLQVEDSRIEEAAGSRKREFEIKSCSR